MVIAVPAFKSLPDRNIAKNQNAFHRSPSLNNLSRPKRNKKTQNSKAKLMKKSSFSCAKLKRSLTANSVFIQKSGMELELGI